MKRTRSFAHLVPCTLIVTILFPVVSFSQDIRGYFLQRTEFFSQCVSNGPAPDAARGHTILAVVSGTSESSLVSGTVSSRGRTWPLTNDSGFLVMDSFLSNAAPAGPYAFTITTASEGTKSKTLVLPAPARRIAPPRVRNLDAAQAINPEQAFILEFDPLRGAGPKDQFRLRVVDQDGHSLANKTLAAGQDRVIIDAGQLPSDSTNSAFLEIAHPLATVPPKNGHPYSLSIEVRSTRVVLRTIHPPGRLRFGSNQGIASETAGLIAIPVERSNGEVPATVDYYIEGITAQPGVNYTPVAGTLTFDAGVTQQVINVPLLNDGVPTEPLIGRAWLTNATGGIMLPSSPWIDWTIRDAVQAPGANVSAVVLAKVAFYTQTNGGLANPLGSCSPNRFFVSVHPSFPGAITDAAVKLPKGGTRQLPEPLGTFLEYNENFPSRASMDRVYGSGRYTVTAHTLTEGAKTYVLRLLRERPFPAPHVTNWDDAQGIDPAAVFRLSWDSFTGATSNDVVLFSIRDSAGVYILRTPEIGEPGALPSATTSYDIPAGTLLPGHRYHVNVIFAKVLRSETDPSGARLFTVFDHTTGFEIRTIPQAGASIGIAAAACCGVQ